MELIINTTKSDNLGQQIISIKNFLNETKNLDNKNKHCINFKNYHYSPPLLAAFFSSFIETHSDYSIINSDSNNYLKCTYFPEGIKPDTVEKWKDALNNYKQKTYLPIIHFSASKKEELTSQREQVISHVCKMIKQITNIPNNYYSGISYLISEITDNIVDHSKKERGWISFQYYKRKGYLDLCIADSGIGLLKSYKNYVGPKNYSHIINDIDAVENVIKGNSTKELKINERGWGVRTSRELLIKGLKGSFIIFSGSAILANYDLMNFKCYYNGTLTALRIPCNNFDKNFKTTNYVE